MQVQAGVTQEIREFCMNFSPDVVVVTKSSYITLMFAYDPEKQPDGARPWWIC